MALVKIPDFPLIPYPRTQFGITDFLIDATGEKFAKVIRVEKTGSITDVLFKLGAVTTAQAVKVTLQTIDATTGYPTGTLYGGSAAGVLTTPTASLLASVLLGTAAAATEGDIIAVVLEFNATVGNLSFSCNNAIVSGFPYCAHFTTAWARVHAVPMLSLKYSDATYSSPNTMPTSTNTASTFAAASAPDEYALKFKTNIAGRIIGLTANIIPTATTGTFDIVLYDTNGTTVLATNAVDPDILAPSGAVYVINFTTPVSVPANVFLYAAIKATGTGNVVFRSQTVRDAGQLVSAALTAHQSSRTDAGAWTDDTLTRPFISPIFSEIETGTGLQSWGSGFF